MHTNICDRGLGGGIPKGVHCICTCLHTVHPVANHFPQCPEFHRKQRGQANPWVVILIAFAVFAIIFAIALAHHGDSGHSRRRAAVHGRRLLAKGEFLKPEGDKGRYAYQRDDGSWYIYYWMMTDSNRYYTVDSGTGIWTYQPLSQLPAGGSWSKSAQAPEQEEVAGQSPEEVAETEAGQPETESEWATQNEDGVENQSVEPENTTEPSESAPSESAPSDSSPSGGDSGGDSGGGDGGGGDGGL